MNPNRTARIAGLLYVLMIPLGLLGILYVPNVLIVAGDSESTIANIVSHMGMFRLSIVTALVVQVAHIFIVLLLYRLLQAVNKSQATLMVIFMLVGIPVTMLNELNHFAILILLNGSDYLNVITKDQLQAMVPMFFRLHENGILIASIFWGLWLLPMGYLVIKSGFISKIPGILLIIAGAGYIIDVLARMLSPNYGETVVASIVLVTLFGEIVFPIWLLIRGVNTGKWTTKQAPLA